MKYALPRGIEGGTARGSAGTHSHITLAEASVRATDVAVGLPIVQEPFAPAKLEPKKTV